jgi:hypothetical protein
LIFESLEGPSRVRDSRDYDIFFVLIENLGGGFRKIREVIDLKTLVNKKEDFIEINFRFYESDDFIGFDRFFIAVHGASLDVQPGG